MSSNRSSAELALNGAPPTVTLPAPASHLHGPQEIGAEEIAAVTEALQSKDLFRFMKDRSKSFVARMEDLFQEKSGAAHVLAVNSGTSALISGLVGLGVSHGDEVLVPAYTYIATAASVLAIGAFPVVVEVDDSFTMDPVDAEKKITPRTKAIIPVHMRGLSCDMDALTAVAKRHNLVILEDCAQANGGSYRGRAHGTSGDAGAYSLQHFKIITSGEGGLLVTNRKDIFDRAAIYHDSAYAFWMEGRQQTEEEKRNWRSICFLGENFRQSELHGAVGYEQLKKRDRILARTRAIKAQLRCATETIPGSRPERLNDEAGDCGISLAFFMETPEEAKAIAAALRAEGVPCGTVFDKALPNRHFFYHWDYIMEKRTPHRNGYPWNATQYPCEVEYSKEMCPQTTYWMERVVSMSITQVMTDEYVAQLEAAIRKVARHW